MFYYGFKDKITEAVRSILVNSHISYNSILSGSTGGTWFVGDIICCHHLSYRYYMLTFFRYYKRITDAKYKHMSCWHPTFMSFPTDFLIDLSNTDLYFFSHNAIYGRRMLFYINITAKKRSFSIIIQVIQVLHSPSNLCNVNISVGDIFNYIALTPTLFS